MNRSIVVGVDGSPAAWAALDWAAIDAVRRRLPLRVVHVREPWVAEHPVTGANQTRSEWCAGLLDSAADRAARIAPEVTPVLVIGAVTERLRAESETADTLVIGSRGLGGAAGLVLGSTGYALAGHTHVPVVVVRAPMAHERGEVVVGYDGSADAEAALAYALEEASARAARVRVIYCRRPSVLAPHPVGYGPLPPADFARDFGEALEPWRVKYPSLEIAESVVDRSPVPALARASRHADLVVVGSRGLGLFTGGLLGSVSHGVLQRAACPVGVVRAPWRPS